MPNVLQSLESSAITLSFFTALDASLQQVRVATSGFTNAKLEGESMTVYTTFS